MGSYTFKWEHPAEEVYVTGTFDDWTKSVKLEKEGSVFLKTVDLKDASKKIYYKFVVDNNWTTNESAPKEPDHEGNINNFLTPEQISGTTPAAAIINTVTPVATTVEMAGEQPKEAIATPSDVPGGFPDTPAEELNKTIGVNPLPAAAGAVNPVTLAPGEKIPESVTAQSITDNVKLDKESYEKADALPGVATQPAISSAAIIPESGLPVTDNTINSVGPTATTATLAGQVPKEPKVPATVKDSQAKAGADPEASAVPEEVREKAEVEDELKRKVPEAATTSEGTAGVGTEKSENTGGALAAVTAAGGAAVGAAIAAKNSAVETAGPAVNQAAASAADIANRNLPDSVKEKLPISAQEALAAQNKEEKREEVSPEVPTEVKQSITEAGTGPEAAANTAAVEEKKAVEAELQKEVKVVPAVDETEGKDEKPEAKPEQPVTDAGKAAEPLKPQAEIVAAANGSGSKPAEATGATSDASATQKKKNRLSTILSKIKHKLSDKN